MCIKVRKKILSRYYQAVTKKKVFHHEYQIRMIVQVALFLYMRLWFVSESENNLSQKYSIVN